MVNDPTTDPGHEAVPEPVAGVPLPTASIPAAAPNAAEIPPAEPPLAAAEIERIVQSKHDAPHQVLGPQPSVDGDASIVRAFLPGADRVVLQLCGAKPVQQTMQRLHRDGLFETVLPVPFPPPEYAFIATFGEHPPVRIADAYRFREARFTAEDDAAFAAGAHADLFDKLGARPLSYDGVAGVAFGLWAPNATRVSVVGPFNGWDGRRHPMQRVGSNGVWELFIPGIRAGELYKFELKTAEGAVFLKADPFAMRSEPPPHRASIVEDPDAYLWLDSDWMRGGRIRCVNERGVHALADPGKAQSAQLAAWRPAPTAGGTYVELPASVAGRAAAGLFMVGAPFHSPEELMQWIDSCHCQGMGVMLALGDLRLPEEAVDLLWFDGTRLYECAGIASPKAAVIAPSTFDTAKGEVRSILLSNILFWLERYHIDALVTDAEAVRALPPEVLEHIPGVRLIIRETAQETTLSTKDLARITAGRHDDPFSILGVHLLPAAANAGNVSPGAVIRAMMPGALAVQLLLPQTPEIIYEMRMMDPAGLFETTLSLPPDDYRFRILDRDGTSRETADLYRLRGFAFGEQDQHLFAAGNHYRIYEKLGAHPRQVDGVEGVGFAVWAPNAEGISVVGEFNGWNGLGHQMRRHGISGVWELFVPAVREGAVYKFEIRASNGHIFLKTDPYAFHTEVPPATASVVHCLQDVHAWRDGEWMERRRRANPWRQPVAIYEVHLGSWMRGRDDRRLTYRELAAKLVPYVKTLGFTHIELLPIAEHPYEPSWGYQVSHFYAPTSRFGPPEELMEFVDRCHEEGIGVILDWVPGHFPKDAHALAWFDGTHLYEHADPRKGEHPDWGTLIFNYGRHEVENFLIANALFWLEIYHFDGLRVDAVASMLYLDYSRPAYGGWVPNAHGGKENLEAIEFLKHTNSLLHARFPGILMIAEESTSWPNVSRPTDQGGLGFGFKWNMGWMHDVLAYMSVPPDERKWHHGRLTFSIVYAFNENFILSLSHDEVVHLKHSLLNKMPGDTWEKFANLRLLLLLMWAHPGKKLLFMGGELGQESEWSHAKGLEWRALEKKPNRALGWFVQDLNRLYREQPELFEVDFQGIGFEWLEADNGEESIIAFLRKARDPRRTLLFAANFSAVSRPDHRIGVPYPVDYTLRFDSNAVKYGGCGSPVDRTTIHAEEVPWHGRDFSIRLTLPALSAVILEPGPALSG